MVPNNYKLVFEDTFQGFELDTNKWRDQQPWGRLHAGSPYQYYGKDSIHVNNGEIVLDQKYSPKEITHWNGNTYYPDYSVGLISSKESWKYGWFEFEAKLPTGYGLWPALWLTGENSWPPEIDVVEGYSKEKKNYNILPWFFKRRVQTNIHYRESADFPKKDIRGKSHWIRKNPCKHYLKYACHWTKDFVHLYYNEKLVRKIESPSIVNYLNTPQYLVLNNAIQESYQYKIGNQYSEFKIRSVKVYQDV